MFLRIFGSYAVQAASLSQGKAPRRDGNSQFFHIRPWIVKAKICGLARKNWLSDAGESYQMVTRSSGAT